ncbi:MAG TPA: hypothetical protein PKL99_10175 [Syntrophales bacterium]|nr:hypothetical protein [Syntrophales bacterium]
MKQGGKKKEETRRESGMNKDERFFLPQSEEEEPDTESKGAEGPDRKKENLSELFFLSDIPLNE